MGTDVGVVSTYSIGVRILRQGQGTARRWESGSAGAVRLRLLRPREISRARSVQQEREKREDDGWAPVTVRLNGRLARLNTV